jgi:putative transcriptional regulator
MQPIAKYFAIVLIICSCYTGGMKTISLRLDELLKERGRTAYWLANEVGMTHGGFYKVMHGKIKALNLELLAKMCEALDCQPGDILVLNEAGSEAKRRKNKKWSERELNSKE